MPLDFDARPILVFWESTRACALACRHCRADAIPTPLPGELSTAEGHELVRSLTRFGRPYPVLIITGGDVLMRSDVFELVAEARALGVPVGLAPSVTPRLTPQAVASMAELGVAAVSVSLDGAQATTHESIRGVAEHFPATVAALRQLVAAGLTVQVNTAVMRDNVTELPGVAALLGDLGVKVWEVFFLVPVGRGQANEVLSPAEHEDVFHFLYEASAYDLVVRTVEGPAFRRVVAWRQQDELPRGSDPALVADHWGLGPLYRQLASDLLARRGRPTSPPRAQSTGTRDGRGVIFIAHDGTVYPAGFLPLALGNVRQKNLATIYRENQLLQDIRAARFSGRCGRCPYRDVCGGSRARAYAWAGNPLAEDPACGYQPTGAVVAQG